MTPDELFGVSREIVELYWRVRRQVGPSEELPCAGDGCETCRLLGELRERLKQK